ncbi:FAD-dependent oxidoreductase [Thiolapillus sp.]|nr:FAD-dependent oxidoreductase [Thiolapillus sp.]
MELAGVLQALGSQVSLIALEDRVLEQFDPMISRVLMREMEKQSIDLHMGFEVNELSQDAPGISVHGSGGQHLSGYDSVIWAVGRSPNTRNLNLEAAGVAVHPNGTISTDDLQNTNVPGIYAIGDITGRVALTPVAIAAGRKLAARLFGG